MAWQDKGVIFKVDQLMDWAHSHAYLPTAIKLQDRIRVFVAFWDQHNYGRLAFIDVDKDNPERVLGYSKAPLVADSELGKFDCDGVSPLSILEQDEQLHLYYAGWRKGRTPTEARYYLFVGLLISKDSGLSFQRFQDEPVIGPRTTKEEVRAAASMIKLEHEYLCLLGTQKYTHHEFAKPLPVYDLEYTCSTDGINWSSQQFPIFQHKVHERLGFGRPAVWYDKTIGYHGLFPVRRWDGRYSDMLYSQSCNGKSWTPLSLEQRAFSAEMTRDQQSEVTCPSLVSLCSGEIAMFYNGDLFGKDGLRLAIWQD